MMDGGTHSDSATVGEGGLGRLMPMHLWIAPSGHIRGAGPTLRKLCSETALLGARFLEVFAVHKPRPVQSMEDLSRLVGQRLHLSLRGSPRTALRGLAVPLEGGQGMLINLSFGIAVADAVREHALTNADFAPTDLTVELLYLTEVKAAVMEELAALNRRLRAAQQAAEKRALTDVLTGLANRRALELALAREIRGVERGAPGFALVQLDLDHFKSVNDTLGHAAGDRVLVRVAEVLRNATRGHDTIARIGGDEFVLILPGPVDDAMVRRIARRIIEGLEQPILYDGRPCRVSASVGAALSASYERPDPDRMLSDADAALYQSKHRGRARYTIHSTAPLPSAQGKTGGTDEG